MKPCSVYCEPDKGIHRWLDYVSWDWQVNFTWNDDRYIEEDISCLPIGTRLLSLTSEPALEAPPSIYAGYPIPVLCTGVIR